MRGSLLRLTREYIDHAVPAPFTRVAYRASFEVLKQLIRRKHPEVEVWPRNSLVIGGLKFLSSDIDVTMLLPSVPDGAVTESLRAAHRELRRILPIFSEINAYAIEDLRCVAAFMNRYELRRDPALLAKVGERPITDQEKKAEALVFMQRMLLSNLERLNPEKFQRYLVFSDHEAWPREQRLDLEDFTHFLCRSHDLPDAAGLKRIIEGIAKAPKSFFAYSDLSPLEKDPHWAWRLFPHYACFVFNKVPETLSDFDLKIMSAQIRWESVGCLSQAILSQDREAIRTHLQKIETRLIAAGMPKNWDGFEGLKAVLSSKALRSNP